MTDEEILKIISRAWGRNHVDEFYCFFPWIDREEQAAAGIRSAGYHEGPAFRWPVDKDQILGHFQAHRDHDLYWCPSLFEYPERKSVNAIEEHALWADLDEVDPRTIEDYPPTVAWETSPGRYQCLWVLNNGDIIGSAKAGGENQRMTYYLGADQGGWDITQLLRLPGWRNHKLEYRVDGRAPTGQLLWKNGRTYQADDFNDLPHVEGIETDITDVLIGQIDGVNVAAVKGRIRLQLKKRIRDLLNARSASGDRSSVLWDIERSLADVGCTVEEIVAIVRATVWNKYEGRADELKRLIIEATKAVSQKTEPQSQDELAQQEIDATKFRPLTTLLSGIKPPDWLVDKILTKGGVGFIAGEPKMFKSWFGLDLAISVASGAPFLNHFRVNESGPVAYIQAEDSLHTIKHRFGRIVKEKRRDHLTAEGSNVIWLPPRAIEADLPINAVVSSEIVLSEAEWQEWLDEQLTEGMSDQQYKLVVIDTLMMVAGDIEENKAQAMTTGLFKPLKQLSRKHSVALILIHHMNKSKEERRAGQRMLGSVANHAWAEDSMFLTPKAGGIHLQTESKSWQAQEYLVRGVVKSSWWQPIVMDTREPEQARIMPERATIVEFLRSRPESKAGIKAIANHLNMTVGEVRSTCNRLTKDKALHQISPNMWGLNGSH